MYIITTDIESQQQQSHYLSTARKKQEDENRSGQERKKGERYNRIYDYMNVSGNVARISISRSSSCAKVCAAFEEKWNVL